MGYDNRECGYVDTCQNFCGDMALHCCYICFQMFTFCWICSHFKITLCFRNLFIKFVCWYIVKLQFKQVFVIRKSTFWILLINHVSKWSFLCRSESMYLQNGHFIVICKQEMLLKKTCMSLQLYGASIVDTKEIWRKGVCNVQCLLSKAKILRLTISDRVRKKDRAIFKSVACL